MLHVGPVWMKEVMRGLGPPWMGEQISEIDQQQQCYFISPCMASLEVLIWCAQDFRTWNRTNTRVTTISSSKNATQGYKEHHLCTDTFPGYIKAYGLICCACITWLGLFKYCIDGMQIFDTNLLANSWWTMSQLFILEAYNANKVHEKLQMDANTLLFTLGGVNWGKAKWVFRSVWNTFTQTHRGKLHTHNWFLSY